MKKQISLNSVKNHHHSTTTRNILNKQNNPQLYLVLLGNHQFICISSNDRSYFSNEFQVDTSILYNQFELYSHEQKWTQIVLLNDLIYKIKESFNKEFESIHQRKLQELAKIREKNTRIKQINSDLDDTSVIWEPDLTEKEKPILLFDVKDSEVLILLQKRNFRLLFLCEIYVKFDAF